MIENHEVKSNMDAQQTTATQCPPSSEEVGRRIGQVAKLLGTRNSAYSIMGVSSATLQRYINGDTSAPFLPVAMLCAATGVRMEWVATGDGPMKASEAASLSTSQSARLRLDTLAQAIGLVQGLLSGRGTLSASDYGEAVAGFYEVLSTKPDALAGKVVELSEFVARRANRGNTHAGPGSTG